MAEVGVGRSNRPAGHVHTHVYHGPRPDPRVELEAYLKRHEPWWAKLLNKAKEITHAAQGA